MSSINVLAETPITMAQLKDDIKKIHKRDEELNFRATKTDEYLKNFVYIGLAKAKELQKKIEDLDIPRLKDEHVVKIIDLLPGSIEELKTIFSGYTITVSADNQKKIVETVKPYVSTKKDISVPAPKEPELLPVEEKVEEKVPVEEKAEKAKKAEPAEELAEEKVESAKAEAPVVEDNAAEPQEELQTDSSPEEKPTKEEA
jgi:DNA-directed RNA polymerase subunit F